MKFRCPRQLLWLDVVDYQVVRSDAVCVVIGHRQRKVDHLRRRLFPRIGEWCFNKVVEPLANAGLLFYSFVLPGAFHV